MGHVYIPNEDEMWGYVIEAGKQIENGYIKNEFNNKDINVILDVMRKFNATDEWLKHTLYDLNTDKYRLCDWLSMCIMGRNADNRKQNMRPLQVLLYSWLRVGGEPEDFIRDLKSTDYKIVTEWGKVKLEYNYRKEL